VAAVALVDINESAVRIATERLVAAGHKAIAIRCDVTSEARVKEMVEQTVSVVWAAGCSVQQRPVCDSPVEMLMPLVKSSTE